MLTNLSLQSKIFIWVSSVVIVSFLVLTLIVSGKTIEMAKKNAFSLAQETADKFKNAIKAELQGARITSETLATVFEALKDNGFTDREMMNDILKNTLAKKEYITAFCIAYEPDALDGKDREYAGRKPAYDGTGRYAPYWNKLGTNIDVEPLYDIDIADWYIVPKSTLNEYITDPYPYEVQGNEVMLASMIFPILHKGRFIGIISSDFVLDKLQDMISRVNPHGQEGYTEILSNAGVIVAHPDKARLGEDLAVGQAHDMLRSDPSLVRSALVHAEAYMSGGSAADSRDADRLFYERLQNQAGNPGGAVPGLPLLSPEMAWALLKADPDRLRSAEEAKKAVRDGIMYVTGDSEYYTVFMPVQFSDVTAPWSVAVSIPMAKIMDDANGIRNYVILVSALSVCIIAVILYVISRNITRPILRLSNTAKVLGEGNFDTPVPMIQSADEIGTLSKAFRVMVEKINAMISELQENAAALEEKNKYLNRINELKDEFLANTSHELRTPINGIIGIVESMIDGATGPLSNEQKYNLAIVSNSGKRLSNMINDILDFTKLKNSEIVLQIKPVDLKTIVDAVLALSKPLLKGKEVQLVNAVDASLPPVNADENRIQQIFYNLIGNAIKFTEKGTITVSAEAGELVAVSVTDTGIGIAPDKFDRIFESFEQADGSTAREYGGTGLGLSVTKKLVELHGGSIGVTSRPGAGSVFTFTLPQAKGPVDDALHVERARSVIDIEAFAPQDGDREDAQTPVSETAYRILAVDDEPVNIQVLKNLLSIRDYAVVTAYNGLEALELIEEQGEGFDLILLDVMMPRMSGYEVCRRLREKHSLSELPVLMLTAKNQIQDVILGFQSGANDYIQKPFDKDELLARMKTLLELKSAMNAATAANRAKTAFLANMSHEIRTPLNAVIGLTHLLLNTPLDHTQLDYAEKMRRASSTLLGLVNDILDFSKVESGTMTLERVPFNLQRVFDDIAFFFQGQSARTGIALRFELDPSLPPALVGDSLRLQQIFINLVDNAFKFTEKGGVTVRAAVGERDGESVTLHFAVEDTGIGMSREQTDSIFAVFTQGDDSLTRRYGGTGLGLSITRAMVELMGGDMSVASEEGRGTVFSFVCAFPIAPAPIDPTGSTVQADQAVPAEEADADENAALRGMRVLLVEDNEVNALIAEELLSAVGIETVTAHNGREALERLAEAVREAAGSAAGPPFDLALMDLQMPEMDGYETTDVILDTPEYRAMPVIAMTAHAFDEERDRCLAAGMKGHLSKPIDVEMLYRTLREFAPVKKER